MNKPICCGMVMQLLFVLAQVGCTGTIQMPADPRTAADITNAEAPEREKPGTSPLSFDDRLLQIAQSYQSYHHLGGAESRWASDLCLPIRSLPEPPVMGLSASADSSTHGRKMYALYVKNVPGPFGNLDSKTPPTWYGPPSPVGQVVVKEAWVPEEVHDGGKELVPISRRFKVRTEDGREEEHEDTWLPYIRKDGHLYHAARKSGLFIMFKLDPGAPGTDEGWVYGTVTADGRQITTVGRVESCMACHDKAPYDHLFGP